MYHGLKALIPLRSEAVIDELCGTYADSWRNFLNSLALATESEDGEVSFVAYGADDAMAIGSSLRSWASENGYQSLFELGQAFGRLIADCEAASWFVPDTNEDDSGQEWEFALANYVAAESLDDLAKLVDAQRVLPSGASGLLRHAAEGSRTKHVLYSNSGNWDAEREKVIEQVNSVHAALWLVFGDVLGAVRELDQLTREGDARSAVPREYRVTARATPDTVRSALQEAEARLNDQSAERVSAEQIVGDVARSIEALARRIWSDEFRAGNDQRERPIGEVLYRKLQQVNPREQILEYRLGSTAMSLYKAYRVPAEHKMDTFRCTYQEARYFVAGIRVLLDLSDAIVKQHETRPRLSE